MLLFLQNIFYILLIIFQVRKDKCLICIYENPTFPFSKSNKPNPDFKKKSLAAKGELAHLGHKDFHVKEKKSEK